MVDLLARIREAIDADEGEDIKVVTPQFERQDDVEPDDPPLTTTGFERLESLTADELEDLGLRPWDGDRRLMLLPGDWYPHIPDGVEVATINQVRKTFDRNEDDGGTRFGALAYGDSLHFTVSRLVRNSPTEFETSTNHVAAALRRVAEDDDSQFVIERANPDVDVTVGGGVSSWTATRRDGSGA